MAPDSRYLFDTLERKGDLMITCIVCAVDGSEHSDKAVELAADLAARYQSKLKFLHVFMSHMSPSDLEAFAENAHLKDVIALERARLREVMAATAIGPYGGAYVPPLSEQVVTRVAEVVLEDAKLVAKSKAVERVSATTMEGKPAGRILEFAAAQDADMIVIGTRGLSGVKGALLGSTSQKVCHLATCTCVTVK